MFDYCGAKDFAYGVRRLQPGAGADEFVRGKATRRVFHAEQEVGLGSKDGFEAFSGGI